MKESLGVRTFCAMAVCGLVAILLGTTAFAAEPLQANTAVLFNFAFVGDTANGGGNVAAAVVSKADIVRRHADDLLALVADGLATNKSLAVVKFEPRLACVQRAVREQRLTDKDVLSRIDTTPAGITKARKMGAIAGARVAVLGSVDKYDYRPSTGEVEMTASIQMIDVTTGRILNMFTATGRAAGAATKPADEADIGSAATYDVAEKLIADMSKASAAEQIVAEDVYASEPVVEQSSSRRNKGLLPAMIGAVLLGLLLGGR